MTTIELPPDLEVVLVEKAQQEHTTPENLAVEALRRCFAIAPTVVPEGATLFDYLKDYIGTINGPSEPIARNASKLFGDYLEDKKGRGHL